MYHAFDVAFVLPRRTFGVANDFLFPLLWSSAVNADLKLWIVMADGGDRSVSKVATSADCDIELRFHKFCVVYNNNCKLRHDLLRNK